MSEIQIAFTLLPDQTVFAKAKLRHVPRVDEYVGINGIDYRVNQVATEIPPTRTPYVIVELESLDDE